MPALDRVMSLLPEVVREAFQDETVSELMINGPGKYFVERGGRQPVEVAAAGLTAEDIYAAAIHIARRHRAASRRPARGHHHPAFRGAAVQRRGPGRGRIPAGGRLRGGDRAPARAAEHPDCRRDRERQDHAAAGTRRSHPGRRADPRDRGHHGDSAQGDEPAADGGARTDRVQAVHPGPGQGLVAAPAGPPDPGAEHGPRGVVEHHPLQRRRERAGAARLLRPAGERGHLLARAVHAGRPGDRFRGACRAAGRAPRGVLGRARPGAQGDGWETRRFWPRPGR